MIYKSPFQKIDPYDWFCGPGSHMLIKILIYTETDFRGFPIKSFSKLTSSDCFTSWCKRPFRFAWFETACWETSCCVRGTSLHCEKNVSGVRSCPPCGCSKARSQQAPERLTSHQPTFDGKTYPWWTPERKNNFFLWIMLFFMATTDMNSSFEFFFKHRVGETWHTDISLTHMWDRNKTSPYYLLIKYFSHKTQSTMNNYICTLIKHKK